MPTTVTGNLKNLNTANQTKAFVRFTLRGTGGNQPRILSTAVISPSGFGVDWHWDFSADASGNISGTLYSTRDAAGTGAGDITCGTSATSCWYGMSVWVNGKPGPETPVHAKNGVTLDITSVTALSTVPAVAAPTGDSTYIRIDGGNINVTLPVTFSATPTFTIPDSPTLLTIFTMTLTGNVTSFTLTGTKPGLVIFQFTEDASGGRTVTFPSNVKGFQSMDTTANAINSQMGYFDGTNVYAIGPQTVN